MIDTNTRKMLDIIFLSESTSVQVNESQGFLAVQMFEDTEVNLQYTRLQMDKSMISAGDSKLM